MRPSSLMTHRLPSHFFFINRCIQKSNMMSTSTSNYTNGSVETSVVDELFREAVMSSNVIHFMVAALDSGFAKDEAYTIIQTKLTWVITEDTSAEDVNDFIDFMQSQGPYVFNVRMKNLQHIPLLQLRGAWGNIRAFAYDGNEPGLVLPPHVQRVDMWSYNQPRLVFPDTVQRVRLGFYNQPDLVLPKNILDVQLQYYNHPGLVLPRDIERVRLGAYNQPDLVLPEKKLHWLQLDSYDRSRLKLFPTIRYACVPALGIIKT